jgi:phosphatidylethanolamine/phosphatidyl-N-methylethanolamine N-methyltransferase
MKKQATAQDLEPMDASSVVKAYKRWAPVYDAVFGRLVEAGVKRAVAEVNRHGGSVLDVGVGTGLSLPFYKPAVKVTGVDLSPDMLERARERVEKERLRNVAALQVMDAANLRFADASFDVTVATYVLTVVPDPQAVMHELARVTKPGGRVIVVNHFSIDKGLRGAIEKRLAGFSEFLGWRPEFPMETLLVSGKLKLLSTERLKPFGLFTLLRFARTA